MSSRLVRGHLGPDGRPVVTAQVTVNRFGGYCSEVIDLLVDTGSDCTILLPKDCETMRLQQSDYEPSLNELCGVAGICFPRLASGHITFMTQRGAVDVPATFMLIFAGPEHLRSVLGMDVLGLAKSMRMSMAEQLVEFEFDDQFVSPVDSMHRKLPWPLAH